MRSVQARQRMMGYLFGAVVVIAWGWYFLSYVNGQDFSSMHTSSLSKSYTDLSQKKNLNHRQIGTLEQGKTVMTVDVIGAVERPGLYELPLDARLNAVLLAAGGPTKTADLGAINLAAVVEDGMQIVVPDRRQVTATDGTSAFAGSPLQGLLSSPNIPRHRGKGKLQPGERIALNQATIATLLKLPGIGQKKAQSIFTYKTLHGAFTSLSQLQGVQGIGSKLLAKILPYLTL